MKHQINLKNISHHFETDNERIELFKGLCETFNFGQTIAIVGPSGAGKSSLLSIAAGIETPTEGEVEFILDGKRVDLDDIRAATGFIFQQFHLMPELDAISNLALPLRLKGNNQAFNIAQKWLKKVGLEDRAKHYPHQLSGGEQQRIAVARAFVGNPKFIFADEPTGNLDARTSESVAQLMFDFTRETGAGLIIVTHSAQLAEKADKTLHLSEGRLELAK
ncbi:ABC transporter ATP-binding protein [Kordiimonas sp. SCSIO 12610]|uniref:ABC transporter ATP-binding protein n=1 Tax=Kordiimonas sp. SCSIO 12610 TaxID=2829597 RepID=UPI00210C5393|nr:ABC transporter ATP-binding protein [Kordiimonas sp. SCSIO 12610]UTW55710.1 ABC transporter ATP-binding protein [Kordiimonas sp. SCSIO 12610]